MNLFCKPEDPVLDLLHRELSANISRVPDGRLEPLMVLELPPRGKPRLRTTLANIVDWTEDVALDKTFFQTKPLASISGERTTSTDASFGLKILSGFLKGFGASLPNLRAHFKDVIKVSFSFENVKITWLDNGLLGKSLINCKVSRGNPMTADFFGDPPAKLLVVDAVITSTNFSFHVEETASDKFSIDMEAIKKELGQAEVKLQAEEAGQRTVMFKGTKPLPFAFTCLLLKLDDKGNILAMPVFRPRGPLTFTGGPQENFQKYQISAEPALLELED